MPLRVPLDLAYSNGNRKLANVIFKGEMIQKVKEHAIKKEHDLELFKKDIKSKEKANDKRYEKELKEKAREMKLKNEEADAKRTKI